MPRASKPIDAVKGHRTKEEIEYRKAEEAKLKSGCKLKARPEVKDNPVAYAEFKRVKKTLSKIEKDDELYSSVINRYCLLQAECLDFEERIRIAKESIAKINKQQEDGDLSFESYMSMFLDLQKLLSKYDSQIMTKRKMMLDIEKENVMTVAAALRSIPKNPSSAEKENPLKGILDDD